MQDFALSKKEKVNNMGILAAIVMFFFCSWIWSYVNPDEYDY